MTYDVEEAVSLLGLRKLVMHGGGHHPAEAGVTRVTASGQLYA